MKEIRSEWVSFLCCPSTCILDKIENRQVKLWLRCQKQNSKAFEKTEKGRVSFHRSLSRGFISRKQIPLSKVDGRTLEFILR